MRNQTRHILIPYAIVILLAYIAFSLPLPIFPGMFLDPAKSIVPDATLEKRMILLGLIMASFPIGQFLGSPILGKLSDIYGRKKIILFSLAGTTIGYLLTALSVYSYSILGMFLGLVLCGFCEGNVTIAQSVVADLTVKEEHRAEKPVHFGWINIFISVGFIIGSLMGGQLADPTVVNWFTFSTPFWFAGGMTILGMGIISWYSKETLKKKPKKQWQFFNATRDELKRPQLKSFFAANFFLALGYFSFFRFFPVFLEQRFDCTASQLSLIMVYDSLAIAAGVAWLIPFLSKRFRPIEALCLFAILLAAVMMICLLPKSPYALIITLPPVGLCLAVVLTNGALLISNTASEQFQGHAMGTLTSVQVLAEMLTGLAGGPLAAYTMALPLYIGASMTIICSLILFNSIRREKKGENV
jgi:DHA1 family tetracycline resistance protein-like MFS transporter